MNWRVSLHHADVSVMITIHRGTQILVVTSVSPEAAAADADRRERFGMLPLDIVILHSRHRDWQEMNSACVRQHWAVNDPGGRVAF